MSCVNGYIFWIAIQITIQIAIEINFAACKRGITLSIYQLPSPPGCHRGSDGGDPGVICLIAVLHRSVILNVRILILLARVLLVVVVLDVTLKRCVSAERLDAMFTLVRFVIVVCNFYFALLCRWFIFSSRWSS